MHPIIADAVEQLKRLPLRHGKIVDAYKTIDPTPLNTLLREWWDNGDPHVYGSFRTGYEYTLPTGERVGVTNGYGPGFVAYYRPAKPDAPIPFDGGQMQSPQEINAADYYGVQYP